VSAVGVSSAPLRGVVLRDVTVRQTKKPYEIRHVRGLRLEGVRINGKRVSLPSNID
jgi:hypothetical protein